jgi:phasin
MDPNDTVVQDRMREATAQGVDQARDAYNRFMDASRRAQDMMTQAGGAMASNAADLQRAMLSFAQDNMQAGFDFAARLAQAKDLNEVMQIQADYTRSRVDAYTSQARELTRMVGDAAAQAKPRD